MQGLAEKGYRNMRTEEQKAKRRERYKKLHANPEYKEQYNAYKRKHRKDPNFMEKYKEYRRKYRMEHPELKVKHAERIKARYIENPELKEKRRIHMKKYRENPQIRERNAIRWKKYHAEHKDELAAKNKRYYKRIHSDPELKERWLHYIRKYCSIPMNRIRRATNQKKYYRTLKGKTTKKRLYAKRHRGLSYNLLNPLFENCNGHHIDKHNVINIPEELHKMFPHKQSNMEQMTQINILAWSFMESQAY